MRIFTGDEYKPRTPCWKQLDMLPLLSSDLVDRSRLSINLHYTCGRWVSTEPRSLAESASDSPLTLVPGWVVNGFDVLSLSTPSCLPDVVDGPAGHLTASAWRRQQPANVGKTWPPAPTRQPARQTTYLINLRRLLILTLLLVNRLRGRLLRLLGLRRRRRLALRLLLFLFGLLRVVHGALVVVVVLRLLLRAVLDQEVCAGDRHGDCAEEPLIVS